MTLRTHVWLHGNIDGPTAFDLALRAILTAGAAMDRYATADIARGYAGDIPDWAKGYNIGDSLPNGHVVDAAWLDRLKRENAYIGTRMGQGLPAITECDYRPDGPLTTEDRYSDDEEEGDRYIEQRKCQCEVSWDTGYAYQDAFGGCANLHARALLNLYASLPPEVSMQWENEFTGDINDGVTAGDLKSFVSSEGEAMSFASIVSLLVEKEVASQ